MDELSKLKKLLHHWADHNDDHANSYKEWAQKATDLNQTELASLLDEICVKTKDLNALFKKAHDMIRVD